MKPLVDISQKMPISKKKNTSTVAREA